MKAKKRRNARIEFLQANKHELLLRSRTVMKENCHDSKWWRGEETGNRSLYFKPGELSAKRVSLINRKEKNSEDINAIDVS